MIRGLTDAMVSVEGEGLTAVTRVVVGEVRSGDWGMGGLPLTVNDVRALAAGEAARSPLRRLFGLRRRVAPPGGALTAR